MIFKVMYELIDLIWFDYLHSFLTISFQNVENESTQTDEYLLEPYKPALFDYS